MNNLPERLCAEVAGFSGYYASFKEAYNTVSEGLDNHNMCLDETDFDTRFIVHCCIEAEGCIDYAFSRYSISDCSDRISFEWHTTRQGGIKFTIRIVQEGL